MTVPQQSLGRPTGRPAQQYFFDQAAEQERSRLGGLSALFDPVTIRDLTEDYENNDEEGGVIGYGGPLKKRPP